MTAVTRNNSSANHALGSATVSVCIGSTKNQLKTRNAAIETTMAGPLPASVAVASTPIR